MCSQLFQAAHKSNHFKDLKVYYFHNCVYQDLFTDPSCHRNFKADTMKILHNIDSEYKVIAVGDATMSPSELLVSGGASYRNDYKKKPDWVDQKDQEPLSAYGVVESHRGAPMAHTYGNSTIGLIRNEVPMFELSLSGLDAAIKKLLVNR